MFELPGIISQSSSMSWRNLSRRALLCSGPCVSVWGGGRVGIEMENWVGRGQVGWEEQVVWKGWRGKGKGGRGEDKGRRRRRGMGRARGRKIKRKGLGRMRELGGLCAHWFVSVDKCVVLLQCEKGKEYSAAQHSPV